jgi:galactose mutarotase-like enzyme
MSVTLENDFLQVALIERGAELKSLVSKSTGIDYMWSGDPAYWGKTSPILFPIVGTLKDDTYLYKGKKYSLSRHGFAREMPFEITEQTRESVVYLLKSSTASSESYPFDFTLEIKYVIVDDQLVVIYQVSNKGTVDMPFSIGGHPAFKVPLVENTSYEDHYLTFNQPEDGKRWPIASGGLISQSPKQFFKEDSKLKLTRDLFYEDALVFKNLKSNTISIQSDRHAHGLDFQFEGFPYFGIWAAKDADFLCLEPWCGIADSVTHNQKLEKKEGIHILPVAGTWNRSWRVHVY